MEKKELVDFVEADIMTSPLIYNAFILFSMWKYQGHQAI